MKIYCVIGDERSGVMALSSAIEGLGGFFPAGEIFHPSQVSPFSTYCAAHRVTASDFLEGNKAFHLYRTFFESLVSKWITENYTDRGFLFAIKYDSYIAAPALAYYLGTATTRFIHVVRQDDLSAVVAKWLARGIRSVRDLEKADQVQFAFEAEQTLARRAYFSQLARIKGWPTVTTEDAFSDGLIDNEEALTTLRAFLEIDEFSTLFPTTRPTVVDATQRAALRSAALSMFKWLGPPPMSD